jgi:hypothetical protein
MIKYITFLIIGVCTSGTAQFIPEQKDQQISTSKKLGGSNVLIPTYMLLSVPYESMKNSNELCTNLIKYGAPPPTKNYLNLINNVYPKILSEIKFCNYKLHGKNITSKEIEDYKIANPDSSMDGIDTLNKLIQMGGFNTVPKTRADLDRCSLNEPLLMNQLKTFESLTGYPDKNWCDKLVKSN